MSSKKVKRFGSGPIEIQKNQKKMFGRSVTAGDLTYLGVNDPTASKEAVVIKRSELEGLQDTLKLSNTARERALVVSEREQEKLRIAELAKQRKERLLEIDAQKKAGDGGLSAEELEQRKSEMLFARGMRQIRDEEHDDVKHMNQLMLYAKIMTTRDQQILEKERIRQKEVEEEKVLDAETDAADKKWLSAQKEREQTLRDRQKAAKNVIITQIQERDAQRMREREQKEAEAQLMLQRIAEIEQREDEERKAKQQAGKQLLEQVVKDNTAQARAKLRRKQEDIDEDARIQEFIRQREAREAELEAEQARIKAEKDKEIAKLRAQQEKVQDRQSAIDELRAKRYQEAKDREWRKKQMDIAQKRDALKQEIALAREQQRAEKARQMAEQALHERDEYYRVIEQQKSQHDHDVAKRQTESAKQDVYRAQLQAQINERDLEKKTAKQRFLKENLIVDQTAAEKARLEAIRQRKLDELAAAGVPEKYRIDLARKKILHASIH